MPIPDWPRPFRASEEARSTPLSRFAREPQKLRLRSLLLPFQTEPASLGFGLMGRGCGSSLHSAPSPLPFAVRYSACPGSAGGSEISYNASGCVAYRGGTAPFPVVSRKTALCSPGAPRQNTAAARGRSDMRGFRKGVMSCFSICRGGRDQFPPNIQYNKGMKPKCQSFFRRCAENF